SLCLGRRHRGHGDPAVDPGVRSLRPGLKPPDTTGALSFAREGSSRRQRDQDSSVSDDSGPASRNGMPSRFILISDAIVATAMATTMKDSDSQVGTSGIECPQARNSQSDSCRAWTKSLMPMNARI